MIITIFIVFIAIVCGIWLLYAFSALIGAVFKNIFRR